MRGLVGDCYAYAKRKALQVNWTFVFKLSSLIILLAVLVLAAGKAYQHFDQHPDRGAIAVLDGALNDSHQTPVYINQGWDNADSLWFYNATQGSNLIPYDFFLALEDVQSTEAAPLYFRRNANMDRYRYLVQSPSFFNPDGLPVGFVKDKYQGKEYLGFTCATCHTGQVNYKGQAIRIDGGPAMADLDVFLHDLTEAMRKTIQQPARKERFVKKVLERNKLNRVLTGGRSYTSAEAVTEDLQVWTERTDNYNAINQSSLPYGFARLDAFGRIYNRVLQHVLNRPHAFEQLSLVTDVSGDRLLTDAQINLVLQGLNDVILGKEGFELMVSRLQSSEAGFPALDDSQLQLVYSELFNEANAPVSYPYLWDVAHTDYVQWNGLQNNAGVGPLGRNTGQVIGVFGNLDWRQNQRNWFQALLNFNLSAKISGQDAKSKTIEFTSSVNGVNLTRLESQLKSLVSPKWQPAILGDIDYEKAGRGKALYTQYCAACHEQINSRDWNRKITSKMMRLSKIETDPQMASNAVSYKGRSGNVGQTYQGTDVGTVIVENTAPARQLLTAVTAGVIGTPDQDKFWLRRVADWAYMLASSFFNNQLSSSVKSGDYEPDTTSRPYASLLAYKARPLNGIWATAPFLHNGSVPSLYDLLLPAAGSPNYCEDGKFRPAVFRVGSREFDPVKVGFASEGYEGEGTLFDTSLAGNLNTGHEYAAGITAGFGENEPLAALCGEDRWDLIEYLKTL